MTTYAGVYASKSSWQLQLDVAESNLNATANTSDVNWALYIYRGDSSTPWNNGGTSYSVTAPGGFSGTFPAYDFDGSHSGTDYHSTPVGGRVLIASGGATVSHSADGTGSVSIAASHAAAATLGTASFGTVTFPLTTLVQTPGTPSSVALAYVSDTQATLSWTNNAASNGQPTSNQVRTSVNGGTFTQVASFGTATSVSLTVAANQKILAQVRETNAAGSGSWSSSSNALYTTPTAPTSVAAAKDGSGNIVISWTDNVAFTEHQHVIEHSTDGGSTWSSLATVASGSSSYTHTSPSTSFTHTYRVKAQNTDTGALVSAWVVSNTVTLLSAPNKPTFPALNPYANKDVAFVLTWVHNPTDTTTQTAYKVRYSTDGGSTWTTTSKQTATAMSASSAHSFATSGSALTLTANEALTLEVQTWGQATTGGSDGTGASVWSDPVTVTFKSLPVVTITAPANSSTLGQSELTVVLGFSQAQSATFVSATIGLYDSGSSLLEQQVSTVLSGTNFATVLTNGSSYSVKATVTDSNGLTSTQVTSSFTVTYASPVTAGVTLSFDQPSGAAQINLTFPTPTGSLVAAVSVTVTRTVNGATETLWTKYPISGSSLTFQDPTPALASTNTYQAITYSADNATVTASADLAVPQGTFAYLNAGTGFATVVRFFLKPSLGSAPSRDSALIRTAGRALPVVLYGVNTNLEVTGTGQVLIDQDSTVEDIETFLKTAGRGCYRDGTGRRLFGLLTGSISNRTPWMADFDFKVTEAA